jgi:glycosyltransferase involved in cell wall biosynthesis
VIVTTYNNPRALRLVLAGLELQTARDFEIVVADDGSAEDTAALIREAARESTKSIRHIWHPDDGFRKCTISNEAILAARGNYLIFLDGDCIPFPTFVEAHERAARVGRFVAGSKVFLTKGCTAQMTVDDVHSGRLYRPGTWWWSDIARHRNRLMLSHIAGVRQLLDLNRQAWWSWRGDNSSTFAEHLHAVGGFDERLSYGGEDNDLGERLEAIGVRCLSRRYQILVLHLEHDRPYVNMGDYGSNLKLRTESMAAGRYVTEHGLRRRGRAGCSVAQIS